MGGARGGRQGNRTEAPINLQAEVVVVHDRELHRRQVRAIREFLLSLAARAGDSATSDDGVGAAATVASLRSRRMVLKGSRRRAGLGRLLG
jgi:hypothetical protein